MEIGWSLASSHFVLYGELEGDWEVMVGRFVEACRKRDAEKSKGDGVR